MLAHDATASTCDALLEAIEGALGNVDVSESSSIDDARVALRNSSWGTPESVPRHLPFDFVMVCLDLPPAPLGGVRLAQEILGAELPVILVTRSLRWIPQGAATLREVPWITPDADATEVARAVGEAVASFGITPPNPRAEGSEPAREHFSLAGGE